MHCWELGQGAGCSLSVPLGTAALTLLHTVTTDPIRCLWDQGGIPGGGFGETRGCLVRCVQCSPLIAQLYELDGDPRRKEFLDDLFSFMQKRGEPPPCPPPPGSVHGFYFLSCHCNPRLMLRPDW